MKQFRPVIAILLALVLLSAGLAYPAKAAGNDFSHYTFTMTDVFQNKTVTFRGNSGRPAMLLYGGIGSCSNTSDYLNWLLTLLQNGIADGMDVWLIDIASNNVEVIQKLFSRHPLPDHVYLGSLDTARGDNVYRALLRSQDINGYTMPLVGFLNAKGALTQCTTGPQTLQAISAAMMEALHSTQAPSRKPEPEPTEPEPQPSLPTDPTRPSDLFDFSGRSFTVRDIVRNQTVTYRGNSGKPTVLIYGALGVNDMTDQTVADLLSLLPSVKGEPPLVYLIDVNHSSDDVIRSALGNAPLPDNVFVGSDDTLQGDRLHTLFFGDLGSYDNVYYPVYYVDGRGELQSNTFCGTLLKGQMVMHLEKIGVEMEDDCTYIDLKVEYWQTDARDMLKLINDFRTGDPWYWNEDNATKTYPKGLQPLTYDYALEKVAMQRAVELAFVYSHYRPDGQSCGTAFEEQGYQCHNSGENIAKVFGYAADAQKAFEEEREDYYGQGHRRNILNPAWKAVGCASVICSDQCFWVQLFSDTVNDPVPTPANDSLTVGTIRALTADINSWNMIPASLTLTVGEQRPVTDLTNLCLNVNQSTPMFPTQDLKTEILPLWKSPDPSVLSVDDAGMLTAKKAGTVVLTGEAPSLGLNLTLPVTVETVDAEETVIRQIGGDLYAVPGLSTSPFYPYLDADGLRFDKTEGKRPKDEYPEIIFTGLLIGKPYVRDYRVIVMGDADCDGEVTPADARIALRASVGLEKDLKPWQKMACRVDHDTKGAVTAAQARLILRGAVGLEDQRQWFLGAGSREN